MVTHPDRQSSQIQSDLCQILNGSYPNADQIKSLKIEKPVVELEHQPEARLTSVHLSNDCIPKVRELHLVWQSDNWLKTIGVHSLEGVTEVVKINWSKIKSVKSRECVYFCLINYGDQCSHEISHWEANADVSSSTGCFLLNKNISSSTAISYRIFSF